VLRRLDLSEEPPQPLLIGGAKSNPSLSPLSGEMSEGQRGSTFAVSVLFKGGNDVKKRDV
jgi:hypothetical protein